MMTKKILALLLALLMLIFSACSTEESVLTKGRFKETDITPEGAEVIKVLRLSDGKLRCYTSGLKEIYTSADNGDTWEKQDGPGQNNPSLEHISSMAAFDDGTIVAAVGDIFSGLPPEIKKITPDGTVSSFSIPEYDNAAKEGNTHVSFLEAAGDNKIALSFVSGGVVMGNDSLSSDEPSPDAVTNADGGASANNIEGDGVAEDETGGDAGNGPSFSYSNSSDMQNKSGVYDIDTGEKIYDILDGFNLTSIKYSDGKLYGLDFEGSTTIYSADNGEKIKKLSEAAAADENIMSFNSAIHSILNNLVYSIDNKGISKLLEDGSKEKITDSSGFCFGSSSVYCSDFITLSDSDFIVGLEKNDSNGKKSVYRIEYDENAEIDPEKSLTVWSLKEMSSIRAAITAFQNKNPDALIKYEVADENESGATHEDIIKNLNTRILAGEGPDIIVLDGLNPESYANKGMLADLSSLVDTKDVYDKIISSSNSGGLFYLPTRFKIPMLFSGGKVQNTKDLKSFVDEIVTGNDKPVFDPESMFSQIADEDKPVIDFSEFDELFDILWASSQNALTDSGKLNTENIKLLAESVKKLSDKFNLLDESQGSMSAVFSMATSGGDNEIVSGGFMSYVSSQALSGAFNLGNIDWTTLVSENTEFLPFPGLDYGAFTPTNIVGINAKSTKQKSAAMFIQEMLSEDIQCAKLSGFPVTKTGIDNWQNTEIENGMSVGEDAQTNKIKPWINLEGIISELKSPVYPDSILKSIINEKTKAYCNGSIDLETLVQEVQNEAKNYLAEQAY